MIYTTNNYYLVLMLGAFVYFGYMLDLIIFLMPKNNKVKESKRLLLILGFIIQLIGIIGITVCMFSKSL
jgi:hypothetical protein